MGKQQRLIQNLIVWTLGLCIINMQTLSSDAQGLTTAPLLPNHAWTASDLPYKSVEARIIGEYKAGKAPEAIDSEYRSLAQVHSKDPVAQFAWIYAARGAAWLNSSEGMMPRYLLDTLTKADPGNVREYTRYRFCLTDETDLVLPVQNAKLIGDRLLASNPKDGWVRLSLINMLCAAPGGTAKALPYALAWVKLEPTNAKAHSSLAQVYFDQWEGSSRKNVILGNKAVAEFQAYLRLAPANDSFRQHAQSFIRHIQQGQMPQG